jgi:hypothetical protein
MFGIKSQGQKNFEGCQLKTLSPAYRTDKNGNEYPLPASGTLKCPVTAPEGFSTTTRNASANLSHLAKTAAKRLCGNCFFADMTPLEYQQHRTEAAAAAEVALAAEHHLELTRLSFQENLARQRENAITAAADLAMGAVEAPRPQPPANPQQPQV